MTIYRCKICGHLYDEEKEGVPFDQLPDNWVCPLCKNPKSAFEPMKEKKISVENKTEDKTDLSYPAELIRTDDGIMDEIHAMALSGKSAGEAMDTLMPVKDFKDILIKGAQLGKFPKLDHDEVDISVTIGKNCKKPMKLEMPVYISHMSFGALSFQAKVALAKGSKAVGTAMCSGEGGVLQDELNNSCKYIFEYVPNKYSCNQDTYDACDAIEIKIGQGTKPGMGGHLPGEKVTSVIAVMRGKPVGEDILSPSRFTEVKSPEDMKILVDDLRKRTGGKPIGIKIAAGDIEGDLSFIKETECDFITIDGRGGATGSSPKFLKDNTSVPTVYAVSRARKFMDENGMTQDLIITGGLRTSGDVVKALAMGADAVAMASAPLMALGCQRYRICGSGKCPVGIATQDPELSARLDIDIGAKRVENFLSAMASELKTFVRITGHDSISEMSLDDLFTTDWDISDSCGIDHA